MFPHHQVLHDSYYIVIISCISSGQWIVPVITGTRSPPLAYSTINTLPGNRGVMFGGVTINERNCYYRINDLYLFHYSRNTIVSY